MNDFVVRLLLAPYWMLRDREKFVADAERELRGRYEELQRKVDALSQPTLRERLRDGEHLLERLIAAQPKSRKWAADKHAKWEQLRAKGLSLSRLHKQTLCHDT